MKLWRQQRLLLLKDDSGSKLKQLLSQVHTRQELLLLVKISTKRAIR
jgi:hypothetical protein